MKEHFFFVKNVSEPSSPKSFEKKILFGRIIPQFLFESSESDRFFNYLHDSNSIFRARATQYTSETICADLKRRTLPESGL